MIKILRNILFTIISAIGVVVVLALISHNPTNQLNGFNRKLINQTLEMTHSLAIENVISVSGITPSHIYFQTLQPGKVLITDHKLTDTNTLFINHRIDRKIISRLNYYIDSPFIHIAAGNGPSLFEGSLDTKNQMKEYTPFSKIFTRSIMVSPNTFVVKGFDSSVKTLDQIFIKGSISSGIEKREKNITELRGDIGISTDGTLNYDSSTNLIVFVYSYRNEFICMDTNLNLLYKMNTIDTTNSYQSKGGGIKTDDKTIFTNTAPSRIINKRSVTDNGMLYNVSGLKGDNESKDDDLNNTAIDIYDLSNRKYIGSFYIPNYKGEKVRQFKVHKDIIIAIYKTNIATFKFPFIQTM